jgi:1,4-dihydroxy-2-naphthoate octaprenyltransferase
VVDGRPAGFVQQITALPDVAPERLAPPGGLGAVLARLAAVTRLPFVTASVLPVLFGLALAAWAGAAFSWAAGLLATLAVFLLHLGANTANDWYDGRSGCDAQNLDYVAPFSGGSRAVSFGLVSERGLAGIAVACFALGSAAGVGLVVGWAPALLWVGLAGAFLGFAYSAPPLRLAARRGLGEAAIFLSFGPLLTLAGFAAGGALPTWGAALAGIPAGLWTTGILWVNEIPDCAGDRAAGKWNLVAVLGRRRARVGVPVLLGLGHLAVVALGLVGLTASLIAAGLLGG